MTQLEGVRICGRRGGQSFLNTVRPNKDGVCPDKTIPCSKNTSPENTICVEPGATENGISNDCPITEIKLVDPIEANQLDPAYYKVLDFKQWKLVYSKDRVDSLPIQATQLAESTPCFHQSQTERTKQDFYWLERDRHHSTCQEYGGYSRDHRYDMIGEYKISEFDL